MLDGIEPDSCPTVRIVSPASPGGFVVINESDRKPHHALWRGTVSDKLKAVPASLAAPVEAEESSAAMEAPSNGELAADDGSLRVSKGPRGKFYLKRGKEYAEGPYETEEEAEIRLNGPFDR